MHDKLALDDLDTILVKFTISNKEHVPPCIPLKGQLSDEKLGVRHQFAAIRQDSLTAQKLVEVGRHRKSRVDTGEPVISKLQQAQVALLLGGLALKGWFLSDFYYFCKDHKQRARYVVVCVYKKGTQLAPLMTEQTEALQSLAISAWTVHVWSNPNKVATINMVNPTPYTTPKYALKVNDDAIVVVPVSD